MNYFSYDPNVAAHAVFPMGGIGAGSVGIGADGRLQDWEIFNRPSKGSVNGFSHFAIRADDGGQVVDTRVLNGPFNGNRSGAIHGKRFNSFGFGPRREEMTGLPHFEKSSLTGPYPVADIEFDDRRFPGRVKLRALSPFIPLDAKTSSLPIAQFEFAIANSGHKDLEFTLFGCIGFEIDQVEVAVRTEPCLMVSGKSGCDPSAAEYAEIALATDHSETSFQRHFYRGTGLTRWRFIGPTSLVPEN